MSIKRRLEWAVIFSVLFLFTFFALGNVPATYANGDSGFVGNSLRHLPHGTMIDFAGSQGLFGRQEFICSISTAQLKTLEASYSVSVKNYNVRHHIYEVATVNLRRGQRARGIEQIVGKRLASNCKVQTTHNILYIFTVPELS